jgi:hypothetical protein
LEWRRDVGWVEFDETHQIVDNAKCVTTTVGLAWLDPFYGLIYDFDREYET